MKRDDSRLYCFSPLVMITTFAVEIGLALYTLWRYRLNEITRVSFVLLMCLAIFQLAEYMVCEGPLFNTLPWSRIGFVAITMLPPLGIHLIYALAKTQIRPLLPVAYGTAAVFIVFFTGMNSALSGHECVGNYVIFQVASGLGGLFGAYYYGWLAVGIFLARHLMQKSQFVRLRRSLTALSVGYAAFIVPTATANIIEPDTVRAIPSIMCGFAVVLAVVLVVAVLPGVAERRRP